MIGIISLVLWIASGTFVVGLFLGMRIGADQERDNRIRSGGR